jgi:hypothetical protein
VKKTAICKNHQYTDGKGNIRIVIAEGSQYMLYPGQSETDNIRYRVQMRGKRGLSVGTEGNQTRASFAQWAKKEA